MKSPARSKTIRRSFPKLPFLSLQMLEGRDVPTASPFFVDDAWVGMPNGTVVDADPTAPGSASRTIGDDAYATINGALSAAGTAGVSAITVNSGDYSSETVNVSSAITMLFQQDPADATIGGIVGSYAQSAGTLMLNAPLTEGGNNGSTAISVAIHGGSGPVKVGTGTLTLSAANDYTGVTTINAGAIVATNATALGTTAGNTVVVNGAALQVSGAITIPEPITINGDGASPGTGAIRKTGANTTVLSGGITLASTARINADAGTLSLTPNGIAGTGVNLTVGGAGTTVLAGTLNIGTGTLNIDGNGGVLSLTADNHLVFSGPINVTNGGSLSCNATTTTGATSGTPGAITLDNGTIINVNPGNAGSFVTGVRNIVLGAGGGTFNWNTIAASGSLIILTATTLITGSGGLTTKATAGDAIAFADPCTYTGPTHVMTGIARVRTSNNRFPIGTALTVDAGASFDPSTLTQQVGSLAGAGNVTIATGSFLIGGGDTTSFTGNITGSTGTVTRSGTGTQTILGTGSTYSGLTTISGGTVLLGNTTGNAIGTGSVTVGSAGTIGSISTANAGIVAGAMTVNGTLAPGTVGSAGKLATANITLGATSIYNADIKGTTAGFGATGYDQTVVNGSVTITDGAKLIFNNTGTTSALGDTFKIIDNTGAAGVTGTFRDASGNVLAQNSKFTTTDGQLFRISYTGGDGNDVVITRIPPFDTRYVSPNFDNVTPITDADPVAPGNQPATFGTTAFNTITSAIAASAAGDQLVINSGTYNEAVNVTKALQLVFQDNDSSVLSLSDSDAGTIMSLSMRADGTSMVLTTGGDNSDTTFAGSISGTGSLIKIGSGTWTLNGLANTYSGATTLASGNIKAGSTHAFSSSSPIAVTSPSHLILNGFSNQVGNLAGDGVVEDASSTANAVLTAGSTKNADNVSFDLNFTGTMQDGAGGKSYGFVKVGSGTLTIPNNYAYTGPFGLGGGSYTVASLPNAGAAGPFGASDSSATNFTVSGGGTLLYTGSDTAWDRNMTWGAGGGTINTAATVTLSGTITAVGTPGPFIKAGAGKLAFTAADAFQGVNSPTVYGTLGTGNVSVTGGELDVVNFRVNGLVASRTGGSRTLSISNGASVVATGTVSVDPSNSFITPIAGPGTLFLRNAQASKTNPTLTYDYGPSGGDGVPFGSDITAPLDFGDKNAVIVGKADRNSVSGSSGDLRIDGAWNGSGSIQFIGLSKLPTTNSHNMHFVLNGNNSNYTGAVLLANADLELTNNNALNAANSLTFDSTNDPNTTNRAAIFVYGHNLTIGSLNDTSDDSDTSFIRNGSLLTAVGGTGTGGSGALGLDADSTITFMQTTDGVFKGSINDGPNDLGTTGATTFGYHKLSFDIEGTAKLTLSGSSTLTGTGTVNGGTLLQNGTFTASPTNVTATGSVGGTGTLRSTTPSGTFGAGDFGTAGQLSVNGVLIFTGGTFHADILGTAGNQFDKVNVNANVDLGGATLDLNSTLPANTPIGTQFILVINTGANAISNTFTYQGNPLTEGDTLTAGGVSYQISYIGGDGNDAVLTVAAASTAPVVTGIAVNTGGSPDYMTQRSRLTDITVTFASDLTAPQFAAFSAVGGVTLTRNHVAAGSPLAIGTLVQTGATGQNGLITLTQPTANTIELTFSNADSSPQLPDRGVEYGSLGDGYWQLALPSATYVSTDMDTQLRRLFGNVNNDSTVDGTDFGAFGNVFGTTPGVGVSGLDFNNDGTVDGTDFGEFGNRFGVTL